MGLLSRGMKLPALTLGALLAAASLHAAGSGPALKDAFRDDFLVGTAIDRVATLSPDELALARREFNVITVENRLKPRHVQPEEGKFSFAEGDAIVEWARSNGMQVIGHTLVWHAANPDWLFKNGTNAASRELMLKRMRAHIHAVAGHYRGRVKGWDVVNEAISDQGGEFLRRGLWQQRVGDDYIAKAFEYAREADPRAELYYNDYGNEHPHKREKTVRLIRDLKSRGVRVDGIGMQMHLELDRVPFDEIERSIVAFGALRVKVMVTELDLDVLKRGVRGADTTLRENPSPDQRGTLAAPPELLERQAAQYARLFALFRRHRVLIDRVTFWNLHDGKSWLNHWPVAGRINHPLLFDRALRPKPAYYSVIRTATP